MKITRNGKMVEVYNAQRVLVTRAYSSCVDTDWLRGELGRLTRLYRATGSYRNPEMQAVRVLFGQR